jgi:hypothetical protein
MTKILGVGEVKRSPRKFHNKELHNFHSLPDAIRLMETKG